MLRRFPLWPMKSLRNWHWFLDPGVPGEEHLSYVRGEGRPCCLLLRGRGCPCFRQGEGQGKTVGHGSGFGCFRCVYIRRTGCDRDFLHSTDCGGQRYFLAVQVSSRGAQRGTVLRAATYSL